MVWPNEALIPPNGVFDFEALVISQGFVTAPFPGRLSALDISNGDEYIIHQSTGLSADSRAYHNTVYYDMDGDDLLDIISVRTGFRVFPQSNSTPPGELVWFKNPGIEIQRDVEWEEHILVGDLEGNLGPDIEITDYDLDGDGVPEFLTTHFFTGAKISVYGVGEEEEDWPSVVSGDVSIRSVDVSTDQGQPFGIKMADLDGDGRVEILATNHQPDDCAFPADIPGRVYSVIPPANNEELYDASKWTTRVLLDKIYPQPSVEGARSSRIAPGKALTFYPSKQAELEGGRPWIVVGGDEAGKVWVFRPKEASRRNYEINVIFDINDFYGPGTTQMEHPEKRLITISTIGKVATRYDRNDVDGMTEIFIPVFEAQEIHVFSFRGFGTGIGTGVKCVRPDDTINCPPPCANECPPQKMVPGIRDVDTWDK